MVWANVCVSCEHPARVNPADPVLRFGPESRQISQHYRPVGLDKVAFWGHYP